MRRQSGSGATSASPSAPIRGGSALSAVTSPRPGRVPSAGHSPRPLSHRGGSGGTAVTMRSGSGTLHPAHLPSKDGRTGMISLRTGGTVYSATHRESYNIREERLSHMTTAHSTSHSTSHVSRDPVTGARMDSSPPSDHRRAEYRRPAQPDGTVPYDTVRGAHHGGAQQRSRSGGAVPQRSAFGFDAGILSQGRRTDGAAAAMYDDLDAPMGIDAPSKHNSLPLWCSETAEMYTDDSDEGARET